MIVVETAAALHAVERIAGVEGSRSRAVLMTMGALHEGHLSLVRRARELADQVVVTIFVNPLQFGESADLDRYPRTLEADCALLEAEGVDVVFAPSVDEVYPGGEPTVTVSAGAIGEILEGAFRPGHFDGVLTVVLKLMHLTQPDVAIFGAKDAQQVIAIRAMVRDLNVAGCSGEPLAIEVPPTVRDADGLALSSRNVFLSDGERADALALNRAVRASTEAAAAGASLDDATAAGAEILAAASGIDLDYFAALNPLNAQPLAGDYSGDVVFAVAARVGQTRLIDNLPATIQGVTA